jgi:hypothetical protein
VQLTLPRPDQQGEGVFVAAPGSLQQPRITWH